MTETPEELPIKTTLAREKLGIGRTRMSAIMNRLGLKNARFVFLSQIVLFLRDNPRFSSTQVYPKKGRTPASERPAATQTKTDVCRRSKRDRAIASLRLSKEGDQP